MARVEVLRGPQGTLYGSSSLGGTVKLITNPPDFKGYYGSAQSTTSGTNGGGFNYSEKLMINAPIVDNKVALRVVGDLTHNSGWISRVVEPGFPQPNADGSRGDVLAAPASAVHRGVNDENLGGFRAALLVKPTDALTITPSVFYQHTHQNGMNAYDNPPGTTLAHYQPFDIAEPYSDEFTLYSLVANYALEDATLTSASTYWSRKSSQLQDLSEQISELLGLSTYSAALGGVGPAQSNENDDTNEFSQEVRLASKDIGPFQWIIGGYYSSFNDTFSVGANTPGLATAAGGAFGSSNLVTTTQPLHVNQEAGFVHASYQFGLGIKLEAGGRYFAYQSSVKATTSGVGVGQATPVTTATSASATGFNPTINLSWSPTSRYTTYVSASKGFREGGGNFPIFTNPATPVGAACLASLQGIGLTSAPTSFGPDSAWSYEVGEKARLFNGRVTFNSDAYDIVWSKVQQSVALSCGFGFTANGPNADVKGGEAELNAQIFEGLTVSQSLGYSYAAFGKSYAPAGVVKGQVLFDAPRRTVSTSVNYEHPLGRFNFVAELQNSYQSSSYDTSYKINRIPSRDLTNIRMGLETDKWSVYAFVNNVLNNREVLQNLNLIVVTGPNFNRVATNQPLTAGLEVGYRF